jgi:rhamnosyltransferase
MAEIENIKVMPASPAPAAVAPLTALRAESIPLAHNPFPNTRRVRPPGFMNSKDVLAVVVSYNGLQKTRQTVEALRRQVGHVHIVDNGSDAESLGVLDSLEHEPAVTVERLGENRGIGYALNRGVQRARQMGCSWLLTMDQDSVVDGSLIEAYRAAVEEDPARVCLAPRITTSSRRKDAGGGEISYAITSGNLVRVSLFDQIGLYDEGFFVDCIDFDFCLRLRRASYAIHRVPAALMQHQLGDTVDLPQAVRKYYARHSPVRRYYMYRNFMYMTERYLFEFPGFIVKLGLSQMLFLLVIGFLDSSPFANYRAIARGLWDYALRKNGPYVERAA